MQKENAEKMKKLAYDVLILSRNTLLVSLRFLDVALSRFEYVPIGEEKMLTDGKHLFYAPRYILKNYKEERERVVRDYLHIVMHCVFGHMYAGASLNHACWDLACDIAVEEVITGLGLKAAAAKREKEQAGVIAELKKEVKLLTAEQIYHYLRKKRVSDTDAAQMRKHFLADDHSIWYMSAAEIREQYGVAEPIDGVAQAWKDVAQRMQMELEAFGKQRGSHAGFLTQNLREVNREHYDYTAFLKKFAVLGEAMVTNDDEFDYVFYTYGLQLYKKMPLVEPLEYKEIKRIKEFVVAIDTSGSTSGELVQKFIQKTYNILKSTESFFSKINLHIIQCDAAIQEDTKITCQEEFDQYLKEMKIRGLGGTDFRPVFQYVDDLKQKGEFVNLKGLIYFTDGYGVFPAKKPEYETAFIYIEDAYNSPDVPPWAIRLVLKRDEI